jgi:hypothetical protein
MSKVITFDLLSKLPVSIGEFLNPENIKYSDGELLPNNLIVKILEEDVDNNTIINTYHYSDNAIGYHIPRSNEFQVWNSEICAWENPGDYLVLLRNSKKNKINGIASYKISYVYPIYDQINKPYDFGPDSQEVLTMRAWIDNIRALANSSKAEIDTLSLEIEMDTVISTFEATIAPL